MGNQATVTAASGLQLDIFSTPAGRRREFWSYSDSTDLGQSEFMARRDGLRVRMFVSYDQVDGWHGSWEIVNGSDAWGGTSRTMADREDALVCAGGGLVDDAARLRVSRNAQAEILRWVRRLGAY